MHLTLLRNLALLPRGQWLPEADSPHDVEECVARSSRAFAAAEQDLARCLPPAKRAYVFGGLATAAATFCIWLLPDLRVRACLSAPASACSCAPATVRSCV